ncbi:hypothetical protein J7M22_18100 [Candidatus Poribacteria bacterium]|nr:hypothetical protein [Candidatus Poribacteria bacterium]
MNTPDFYKTDLKSLEKRLANLKKGGRKQIGLSAGKRPIYAVFYGEKEPIERTANLSSALAAQKPEAFFGKKRRKQVLMIISAVHGAEMESIAGVMNLLSVLETGKDLKGQAWPELKAAADRLRLVIVPCLNPDGRARIPSDDPTRWTEAEREKYRHGLYLDGSPIGWPACKVPHPRDPMQHAFLGGYFNDAGVNPLHGVFLPPEIAPETHAALALALEETPDCVLDLHSCGSGPFFIVGDVALPESYNRRQYYIDGFCRRLLQERLGIHRPWMVQGKEGALTLNSTYYHLCGALPLIFEGAHGAHEGNRYTHGQIVDMYLTIFEGLMIVGSREGFKPHR